MNLSIPESLILLGALGKRSDQLVKDKSREHVRLDQQNNHQNDLITPRLPSIQSTFLTFLSTQANTKKKTRKKLRVKGVRECSPLFGMNEKQKRRKIKEYLKNGVDKEETFSPREKKLWERRRREGKTVEICLRLESRRDKRWGSTA